MRRSAGIVLVVLFVAGLGSASASASAASAPRAKGQPGYLVYWDQNEEQDFQAQPSGQQGQLIAPWDANGQMCLLPDGSGHFVTGYNPTTDPTNPGYHKPVMQPPIGEAIWDQHGNFTGQTVFVPGPYMLPGQTVGGDVPPDAGSQTYNNNGTMTGCAFDAHGNLFATDLGTAQGQFPPPDDGRLIEWFGPSYSAYCIVIGPQAGGVGPHHVDGTGGLRQPGELAFDDHGNLLLPQTGKANDPFAGRVVRFAHEALPQSAADCGSDGIYPRSKLRRSYFMLGNSSFMPFPQSVALDPLCDCWGVATTIGSPAIAWFDDTGRRLPGMGEVPGETISQVGSKPKGWNPFGMSFAPDGTAYFADIHIVCSAPLTNCGPQSGGGRIMKVTFTGGKPDRPTPIATGYSFPTSVLVCVPRVRVCPLPSAGAGRRASPAPAVAPSR
jgi:hypothetical protein